MVGTNLFAIRTNDDGNDEYVALVDTSNNPIFVYGATVPTSGSYAKGCLFIKTGVASGTKALYENQGDTSTPSFNLIGDISSAEIADGAITTAKLASDAVTEPKVVDSAGVGGLFIKKTALAVYDFSVDGGTAGTITLTDTATLPDNSVITAITYDVITTCTSASDASTIALSVPTDGALSTAIAISDVSAPWDAGVHLGSVITPIAVKTTAARALQIDVAGGEDLTAGKIVFAVDYYVSQ